MLPGPQSVRLRRQMWTSSILQCRSPIDKMGSLGVAIAVPLMVAMRLILFCFLVPIAGAQGLLGDRVQVGAIGGVSLSDPLRAFGRNESKPFLVGPSVELRVHGGFVIEVDALYRRLGSSVVHHASRQGTAKAILFQLPVPLPDGHRVPLPSAARNKSHWWHRLESR